MSEARRTELEVNWNGKDISADLNPYLLALTYTDHLSGAADDLQFELHDRDGVWSGWQPAKGDVIEARITAADAWLTDVTSLRLGTFVHDELTYSGPPKKLVIKAVSAALSTGLRRHRKSKVWSGVSLHQIAQDIAAAAGLTLYWNVPDDTQLATRRLQVREQGDVTILSLVTRAPKYKRREQRDQSDLDFLLHECNELGFALKVSEGQIVIFDEYEREQEPPVGAIELDGGHVLGWQFVDGKSDHYGRCTVRGFNPLAGKGKRKKANTLEATFREPDDDGPTLSVRRLVHTKAEAEAIARGLLRAANRSAKGGRLDVIGDPGLFAGAIFDLRNAYDFEDRYIVTKAEHRLIGGYTIGMEIRRCLEAY